MTNIRFLRVVLVFCSIALVTSACSRSADEDSSATLQSADGLLQYVPADTSYAFAMAEPLPQEVIDKMQPHLEAILLSYRDIWSLATSEKTGDLDEDSENAAQAAQVLTMASEIAAMMSSEGLSDAGLSLRSRSALYGVGLVPVMRIELTDVDAFEATIARLEEKGGNEMSVASIDGQSYRYVGNDEARLIIAVIDSYLVVSAVPTALPDEQLSAVLGLTLPKENIGSAGILGKLADEYGYTPHALGFIDMERLAATFLDQQSGVNAELLELMDFDASALSDVCRAEIRDMSGVMPRIVAGYTELNAERIRSNAVFEIRNDIATGLAKLAAAVPGLGEDNGGLLSFGMSLDLLAARDFYSARLDALEADPYKCELFAELQNGVAKGRAALNQPIPPIAYGFKGFLAVVDSIEGFDLATRRPPTDIDARFLVAIDNAAGLLAMGTMFSPELAALDLQPDGKPVKFDVPQLVSQFGSAYVAMTDNALGMAVGTNAESDLTGFLVADGGAPPPVVSLHMDAGTYYEFLGEAMLVGGDEEPVETSAELLEAVSNVMTQVGDLLDRMSFNIVFTEQGIEFQSLVTLSD
ncbi:MAG: hypothetical protein GXP15_02930 [Gammaproteobacteria bacterium]|nr:hypothetical protein [Gammaproteobacteria bacterium]